ncbi:hypothetical protein D1872_295550 [compost metagenome]
MVLLKIAASSTTVMSFQPVSGMVAQAASFGWPSRLRDSMPVWLRLMAWARWALSTRLARLKSAGLKIS